MTENFKQVNGSTSAGEPLHRGKEWNVFKVKVSLADALVLLFTRTVWVSLRHGGDEVTLEKLKRVRVGLNFESPFKK